MTYTLHVIAREVPANDAEVFTFLEQVAGHTVSMAPSQQLKSFREAALKLFPCRNSYTPGDPGIENCPWADGPLGENFKGGYGTIAIARRQDEVIPHLLRIASDLGMTVADEQTRAVHRPQAYQVVLDGPLPGVEVDVAATQLAELMNQPLPQMVQLLYSRRRTLVKKGLTRVQAEVYVTALRERASCAATALPESRKQAAAKAQAKAAMPPPEPVAEGIEADDDMFTIAESQRMAAAAVVGGIAVLAFAAVHLNSPFVISGLLATGVLGLMAAFQFGQAMGSGMPGKLLSSLLAAVPGLGTLLLIANYFRAAGVLKNNGITSGNGLASSDAVRELGGMEGGGMLPSTKIVFVLLILAVVAGAMFMPKGH